MSLRSQYTSNTHRSPLELRSQNSLAQERFASNGVQKIVHVVVKNQPFLFELGFSSQRLGSVILDFNHVTVNAELVYDNEDLHRVDFVKKKPIEFKAHIADSADRMTVEMRMKVLSSQLEDMHFRVRFSGHDTTTKDSIASLVCYSEPIKVVSKPEQVHKIQAPTAPRPRKRKAPADVEEVLERIELHQKEQRELLNKLLARDSVYDMAGSLLQHCIFDGPVTTADPTMLSNAPTTTTTTTTTTSTSAVGNAALAINGGVIGGAQTVVDPGLAFESLFQQLLTCYSLLSADERPSKIRKVVLNTPSRDNEKLSELLDQFQYEVRRDATRAAPSSLMPHHEPASPHSSLMAALRQPSASHSSNSSVAAAGDFDKIDEFFTKEFLSLPLNSTSFL